MSYRRGREDDTSTEEKRTCHALDSALIELKAEDLVMAWNDEDLVEVPVTMEEKTKKARWSDDAFVDGVPNQS